MPENQKKRIMLTVAYDGTRYCGWQVQPNGVSVAGVINETLRELLGKEISVIGASRTDAGVHALCNIAVFDTCSPIPGEKMSYALNQRLPEDIRITGSKEVAGDFHPRHTAACKTYEYHIVNTPFPNPVKRLYSHFIHAELDVAAMQEAAAWLVGEHDFKSFCTVGAQVTSTVRKITDLQVFRQEDEIVVRVTGTGFLYNMVRIIVGTLLDVGFGRKKPEDMPGILAAKNRGAAGSTAPAKGLILTKYIFPEAAEEAEAGQPCFAEADVE